MRVIEPYTPGEDNYYEFDLPVTTEDQSRLRKMATGWISPLISMSHAEIARAYRERLSGALHPEVAAICMHLADFLPTCIANVHGDLSLLCTTPERVGYGRAMRFLPGRADRDKIQEALANHDISDPRVVEFLHYFGGMRDSYALDCGYFWSPDRKLETIDDLYFVDPASYSTWKGAVVLFTALNGDVLILHSSGRVGWGIGELAATKLFANSFEEFCAAYLAHLKHAWRRVTENGVSRFVPSVFDSWDALRPSAG